LLVFPNYGYGIAAYLFRQSTISMAWPLESSFIGELLPPRSRARAFGLRSASWNFGYSFAAVLGGRIIVRTGYDWTFASMAFFVGLAALIHLVYYKRHPVIRGGGMPSALPARRARVNTIDPVAAADPPRSISA
jgi:MFS family permease